MRYNIVSNIIGSNLRYIGVVLLLPILFALAYKELDHVLPFVCASFISILLGFLFTLAHVSEKDIDSVKKPEALAGVFFSWVFFAFFCSIPNNLFSSGTTTIPPPPPKKPFIIPISAPNKTMCNFFTFFIKILLVRLQNLFAFFLSLYYNYLVL